MRVMGLARVTGTGREEEKKRRREEEEEEEAKKEEGRSSCFSGGEAAWRWIQPIRGRRRLSLRHTRPSCEVLVAAASQNCGESKSKKD